LESEWRLNVARYGLTGWWFPNYVGNVGGQQYFAHLVGTDDPKEFLCNLYPGHTGLSFYVYADGHVDYYAPLNPDVFTPHFPHSRIVEPNPDSP